MKSKPKINNLVHKHSVEYNKPKTHRNRKKEYARKAKYENFEHDKPVHRPYTRSTKDKNYLDEYEDESDDGET